ncbi:MAG: PAS domain-containing protein [Cyanobacteria bacterium SBLK]|nr:PAS domain-containing protein [Cyanobacteria bacterium SBLK]
MSDSLSLDLFGAFLADTPNAIALFDRQMNHITTSQQWYRDYDLNEENIIGRSLFDPACQYRISPRLLSHWQNVYPQCLQGEKYRTEGYFIFKANGEKEWVQWEMSPWQKSGEKIGGIILSSRFITPWKQQEEILRKTEERFLNLSANLPGMIFQFLLYEDGRVSYPYVSSGCQDLFEVEPEAIQDNPFLIIDRIHPDDRKSHDESVAMSARLLSPFYWEGRFVAPSGQTKWIEASSRPERQFNGAVLWDGLIIDITPRKIAEIAVQQYQTHLTEMVKERTRDLTATNEKLQQEIRERERQAEYLQATLEKLKETQAQLIQTEKMSSLGQLVGGIAHEINNPISFIYGNIDHLNYYTRDLLSLLDLYDMRKSSQNSEIKTFKEKIDWDFIKTDLPHLLESMKVGSQRIRDIILSLQNFSRHDESEIKFANIREGLESTLRILGNRLKLKCDGTEIKIIREYRESSPIECYPSLINQVFMYIFSNAIDALESDRAQNATKIPTITVKTQSVSKGMEVTIQDNGCGMTEEIKNKLFDPFFTTKPVGVGTGLGLTTTYQIIVEQHQGRISIESQLNQGTKVTILLRDRLNPITDNP